MKSLEKLRMRSARLVEHISIADRGGRAGTRSDGLRRTARGFRCDDTGALLGRPQVSDSEFPYNPGMTEILRTSRSYGLIQQAPYDRDYKVSLLTIPLPPPRSLMVRLLKWVQEHDGNIGRIEVHK